MNSMQLSQQINALIIERDSKGADVQGKIDSLFDEFEKINAKKLAAPTEEHIAYGNLMARIG